jgi:hypothetical protein
MVCKFPEGLLLLLLFKKKVFFPLKVVFCGRHVSQKRKKINLIYFQEKEEKTDLPCLRAKRK